MKHPARIAAIALAVLVAACSSKEDRIDSHLAKSRAFLAAGELEKASLETRNVVQIDPRNAEAYVISGLIEEARQAVRPAFAAYSKALELDPANVDAKRRLARFYLLGGDPAKAEEMSAAVLAAAPGDPDALAVQAALLAAKGDAAGAIAAGNEVLEKHPGQADAAALVAGLYARQKDDRKAEAVLARAIAADPKSVSLRSVHAAVALRLGARDKAEQDLREIVALEPSKFEHRLALAGFHARADEVEKAERVLREAIAAAPDEERRRLALVELLAARRGPDAAEAELRKAIADRPRLYPLRFALADLLNARARTDEAEAVYGEIIALDKTGPQGLAARLQLARAELGEGRSDEAGQHVAEILQANPRDGGALLLRARLALAKQDPANAIIDLRAVLKDQPGSLEVLALLAAAHRAAKEVDLGRQAIANAVALYPDRLDLRLLLADYEIANNDPEAALKEIDQAIKRAPRDPRAYEAKARLQVARRDLAGAEQTFASLKKELPDAAVGYYRTGVLLASQKKFEPAAKELEAAIARAPGASDPLVALVGLYIQQGRLDLAAARATAAIEAQPEAFLPHVMLGEVQVAQKKFDLAEKSFRRAIELNPRAVIAYLDLARLFSDVRGDTPRAIEVLREGLKAIPDERQLWLSLAGLYQRTGQADKAIAEYEAIVKANPRNALAANNLAVLLSESRSDKASLERALELARRFERSTNPAYLDTLGWIHYKRGEYDKAVPLLQKAVEAVPKSPVLQYHLGMALYKAGKAELARTHLRQALDASADFPGADEARRIVAAG